MYPKLEDLQMWVRELKETIRKLSEADEQWFELSERIN